VPLARYFVFVGSVLVALLFVVNWMSAGSEPAQPQDTTAQAALDAPIARIHSIQKWPDKIDFDTSKPTIVPPAPVVAQTAPAAVVATNAAAASPLDARAEVKPNIQPAPAPQRKRVARTHHRNYPRQDYPRQATSTWADANPMARSWSWNW
jgi:hypothetical protein